MVSIEFHLRPSKRGADYPGHLFVRVIANRKTASQTLPYRLYSSEWNEKEKRICYTSPSPVRTKYLEEVEKQLLRKKERLREISLDFPSPDENTAREILSLFSVSNFQGGIKKMSEVFISELLEANRERTARAYRTVVRGFLLFEQKNDLPLSAITSLRMERFEKWMKDNKKSLNTISFYMRNLRAIYNKGIKRGWSIAATSSPFQTVYTSVAPSPKRALTLREMRKLENLLENPSLQENERKALSLFLFSFHGRGISFVDMAFLRKENVKDGFLCYFRRKTGTPMRVKVTAVMQKFLTYFKSENPLSDYLLPIIKTRKVSSYMQYCDGLQKQNKILKKIAGKAGIEKKLSTHMARHSWATIAKKENIPIWVISESLGHRSVETTYIYLDSFASSVLDKAAGKVSRAVSRIA